MNTSQILGAAQFIVIKTMEEYKSEYQNELQDKRIDKIEERFNIVCDHYNHQITGIREDIGFIRANQKTLMWFMFAMVGTLIALYFK